MPPTQVNHAPAGHPQLVLRLLAAGADPDVPNLSGFTALDVSLGGARRALETVTTRLTDPALLQVVGYSLSSTLPCRTSGYGRASSQPDSGQTLRPAERCRSAPPQPAGAPLAVPSRLPPNLTHPPPLYTAALLTLPFHLSDYSFALNTCIRSLL